MLFKAVAPVLLLFSFSCVESTPFAHIAYTAITTGGEYSLFGLAINPTSMVIVGGAMVGKWIWNALDEFKPGPFRKPTRGGKKWGHLFDDKARKRHGFKKGDSQENLDKAEEMIGDAERKGKFVKEGVYELRKVIGKGVVLVVRVFVSSKLIDIGTMFIKDHLCGHGVTTAQYIGSEMGSA